MASERNNHDCSSRSSASFTDALQGGSKEGMDDVDTVSQEDGSIDLGRRQQPIQYNIYLLLTIQCVVCFLSNGALPSIQSYSCLPYGNTVYHLAVTLNAMANPMMAFLAFFLPCSRKSVVYILTALSCGLA